MITYSNKCDNISPMVLRSLLIEWTHMLDEHRTAGLVSLYNNNNANAPLFLTFNLN